MAMKYIAIPEAMYRALVQSQSDNQIGTELSKTELEKVQKSRTKNLSSKNVLYNQELRRYLKTKKDEDEKPIKVEVTNGPKGILKKIPTSVSISRQAPKRARLLSMNSQDSFNPNDTNGYDTEMEYQTPQATTQDFESSSRTIRSTPRSSLKDTRYERS